MFNALLLYSGSDAPGILPQTVQHKGHHVSAARLGRWLFRQRTWLPVPLIALLLLLPPAAGSSTLSAFLLAAGASCVVAGELVRIWAVRHIGDISRTRSDRLGPVVSSGPFRLVRNPLYLGNILLWVGFALSAGLPWMVPLIVALLGLEYHAIVRWEEELLEARRGDEYLEYMALVPRWIPALTRAGGSTARAAFSWRETFFSERGTLLAIGVGYVLIWLRYRW